MSLQIEPRHLKIVLDILGPHAAHTAVFGSRAKGTARTLSDLDLVMRISIAPTDIAKLRAAFEESNLPYKVDLVLLSDLSADFLELVEKDFVPLTAPTP
ncbi:MAG: nucleotidyltransferase domain-containing protein [Bdellovibrionaceae bacterium]|nr:nucleotidyltransferase domain-containing protein [Pseudobdellovibrionaceae bacterium]